MCGILPMAAGLAGKNPLKYTALGLGINALTGKKKKAEPATGAPAPTQPVSAGGAI